MSAQNSRDVELVPAMVEKPFDWSSWEDEKKVRAEAREAKREEMEKCLDPQYAASQEMKKPVFKWRVEASWKGVDVSTEGDATRVSLRGSEIVMAQTEADAWAAFCDRLGTWPSRHHAKPTITRLERIAATDAIAGLINAEAPLPEKVLVPMRRANPNR